MKSPIRYFKENAETISAKAGIAAFGFGVGVLLGQIIGKSGSESLLLGISTSMIAFSLGSLFIDNAKSASGVDEELLERIRDQSKRIDNTIGKSGTRHLKN